MEKVITILSDHFLDEILHRLTAKTEILSKENHEKIFFEMLKIISDYLNAKSISIFVVSNNKAKVIRSHNDFFLPTDINISLLKKRFPVILNMFNEKDEYVCKSLDEFLEDSNEKIILEREGITSFYFSKIMKHDIVFGFFAYNFNEFNEFGKNIKNLRTFFVLLSTFYRDIENYNRLFKSYEKFELFANGSVTVEEYFNTKGDLEFISPSCEEMTGYTQNEFYSNQDICNTIIISEDREKWIKAKESLQKTSKNIDLDIRIKRKDKKEIWLNVIGKKIYNSQKEFAGYRYSCRDVSEKKQNEFELQVAVERISALNEQLEMENLSLQKKDSYSAIPGFISKNDVMLEIIEKVKKVSKTNTPVLIIGETGTGKELVARAIHDMSNRMSKPLITVNCASIPSALIESELFGREKGAYTGAISKQIGRFKLADHSSIFLDEIGELPFEIQAKLLRVLQFGEYHMLGSPKSYTVDTRIIAATNRDLEKACEEGLFREDLYYRINVFPIKIPPLRERRDDIPLLVWEFIHEFNMKMGRRISHVSSDNMDKLVNYQWPGNLRELRNVIEYSMILSNSRSLQIELHSANKKKDVSGMTLEELERDHINTVLEKCHWKIRGQNGAAKILGLNESTLRYRMKKLNIKRQN